MAKSKRLGRAAASGPPKDAQSTAPVDRSTKVYQRDKIDYDLNIHTRSDLTEKQRQFIDLVMDRGTKLVFVEGPAGTSKTFLAVYCGLLLLQKHAVSDILYVRSIAESASKSLGSLPGEAEAKMAPFLMPLYDKLDELLPRPQVDRLTKEQRIVGMPVNFLRGSSFNAKFIIADESQNFDMKELTTLVTRLGQFSKMIVAGDKEQSDINGRSGFTKFCDLFNDETSRIQGIHYFAFTKDDIVRSGILKYIVERLETLRKPAKDEPMFPHPPG